MSHACSATRSHACLAITCCSYYTMQVHTCTCPLAHASTVTINDLGTQLLTGHSVTQSSAHAKLCACCACACEPWVSQSRSCILAVLKATVVILPELVLIALTVACTYAGIDSYANGTHVCCMLAPHDRLPSSSAHCSDTL